MLEPMTVRVEVWPVTADETGLWLVSGDDAWRTGAIMADSDVHFEVESLLAEHGCARGDTAALHSTSWRPAGPSLMHAYMAVLRTDGVACGRWPGARPVSAGLAEAVGKPPTHAATEAPVPRFIDVLMHGLRHLRFLMDHDATNAAAMGDLWRQHLEPFEPALAGMYSERHEAA